MDFNLIEQMEINSFLTWEFLGTFAGAVVAVTALTQVVKKFVPTINAKWISLVLSFVIVLVVQVWITGDFKPEIILLAIFNALIVCGMTIGAYETTKSAVRMIPHEKQ